MIFHASVMLDELEKKLDRVVLAGFYPEIRMNDAAYLMRLSEGDVKRMRSLLDGCSLTTFTHGPFLGLDAASLNDHIAEYSAGCLVRGLEVTAGLGGSVMIVHTNYSPFYSRAGLRAWLGNWSVRMRPILETADRLGVQIALENVWDERPESLVRLIDLLPEGAAKVCLDTGHINAFSRLPVRRWWDVLGGKVVALHLHDNDGLSDDHLPPGDGVFDFPALVELVRALEPLPLMTLEVDISRVARGRRYLEELFAGRA
ncbi:MAG: sugar phosphate isomerase/epimerase [Candidatus Krumholzibacteria bacterium]|nr:sugar phosphate isomerase/epimerase [Candidatus Krumholzibacteria bacterium]